MEEEVGSEVCCETGGEGRRVNIHVSLKRYRS